MVDKLQIRMMPTIQRIKVANCAFEKCVGHLRDVPIQIGELVGPLEFSLIEISPYDVIIGLPTMIKLYYRLVLKVHFEGDSEIINYEYEREVGDTSEDVFTSDDIGESNNDGESDEGLVIMLSDEKTNTPDCEEDELVNRKLCPLNQTANEGIENMLSKYPEAIANSLWDVRQSTVVVTHRFELTSDNFTHQKATIMSPIQKEAVHKELGRILAAGIITPVESSWTSPVFIAIKKDGAPRFCVDYRKLNSVMYVDR